MRYKIEKLLLILSCFYTLACTGSDEISGVREKEKLVTPICVPSHTYTPVEHYTYCITITVKERK